MSNPESCRDFPNICWSKPLTAKFIQLYRQNPCLWNVKLESYKNRDKRIKALKAIAAEMWEHGAPVTTDDIKKKIDTIRNQYRRETRKMKVSMRSEAGSEDVYIPKLWCFNDLTFLIDSDTVRPSVSNMDTHHNTEDVSTDISEVEYVEEDTASNVSLSSACPEETSQSTSSSLIDPLDISDHKKKKKKLSAPKEKRQLSMSPTQSLALTSTTNTSKEQYEDDCICFGKLVTMELRKMDEMQRHTAKKLISDIIFYGHMKSLTPLAKVDP
ncbi:hypothetical protein SK128_006510 [Halocaridina rubra]|uniref:MADF domain-containing protein n=1 Tax=Halocaridina rubra TaxID=373956 RepID=A0AAN9A9T1_HALRR